MKYILPFFLILSACASTSEVTLEEPLPLAIEVDDSIDESIITAQANSLERLKEHTENKQIKPPESLQSGLSDSGHPAHFEVSKEVHYQFDTRDDHPKVKKWVRYYSQKDRQRFQRFLNRGAIYKTVIQDLLVTNGLPPDLYYLGILESGYVTQARSHAGAVGPWQFMAPTGREYGLKINSYVDERQDPVRSTLAAIRYLKELYRQKKSWPLAMAAYNAGPGRVRRAMRRARYRGKAQNYWSLSRRRLLPYDTREYVPQFLAMLSIGKNLGKYDFSEKPKKIFIPRELVKVPSPIHIKSVAKELGISMDTLKELNPHLRKGITLPGKKSYALWVPKRHVAKVESKFNALAKYRIKGLRSNRYVASRGSYHRVRRGQNLSGIARRYGTSVRKLKRINRLRSSRIYVGQKLKVRGGVPRSRSQFYRVRSGDHLTKIARRHGTSVTQLKRLNGLRGSKIFKGQKLRVRGVGSKVKRYKIRRGDNLTKIARKFGLTVRRLKRLNKLRSNIIRKGQILLVSNN